MLTKEGFQHILGGMMVVSIGSLWVWYAVDAPLPYTDSCMGVFFSATMATALTLATALLLSGIMWATVMGLTEMFYPEPKPHDPEELANEQ